MPPHHLTCRGIVRASQTAARACRRAGTCCCCRCLRCGDGRIPCIECSCSHRRCDAAAARGRRRRRRRHSARMRMRRPSGAVVVPVDSVRVAGRHRAQRCQARGRRDTATTTTTTAGSSCTGAAACHTGNVGSSLCSKRGSGGSVISSVHAWQQRAMPSVQMMMMMRVVVVPSNAAIRRTHQWHGRHGRHHHVAQAQRRLLLAVGDHHHLLLLELQCLLLGGGTGEQATGIHGKATREAAATGRRQCRVCRRRQAAHVGECRAAAAATAAAATRPAAPAATAGHRRQGGVATDCTLACSPAAGVRAHDAAERISTVVASATASSSPARAAIAGGAGNGRQRAARSHARHWRGTSATGRQLPVVCRHRRCSSSCGSLLLRQRLLLHDRTQPRQ